MNNFFRLSAVFLVVSAVSVSPSFAKERSSYDRGYDHGYDDGYEDGMDDCPCPPKTWHNGFYLGLGAGYEGFQVKRTVTDLDVTIARFNTHANGWNGQLFGGYSWFFANYFLAAELFGTTSSASGTDRLYNSTNYDGKVSIGNSIGASILPGYRLNTGPLLFARLGYVETDFKVNDWSGMNGSNTSKWVSGFNTGLGVEFPLSKKINARFEYDYIDYGTFHHTANLGSKNSASDNRGSIGFVYRF